MKLITYALFKGNETFLFNYHLRGIYFNVRMNNLLCPEWKTWVAIEEQVYDAYNDYFVNLQSAFGLKYMVYPTAPRCEAMLWRLKPIWFPEVEVVYNKDADSVMLWREKMTIDNFVNSDYHSFGISDVPQHSIPMLGGAVGFKTKHLKEDTGIGSWEELRSMKNDLSTHGQDQELLMESVWPRIKANHKWYKNPEPDYINKLWEADLTARHICSAGVVEMELIRFLRRFDKHDYTLFEKHYSNIFYWYNA